jgi:hypothetical protein
MSAAGVLAQSAAQLRGVLAEADEGELTCPPATRRRLEGAALALDVMASGSVADASTDVP